MNQSLFERASSWVARDNPSRDQLLGAHNALIKKIRAGQEPADMAEPALEFLGEKFVDAGGDPMDLLDLEPAQRNAEHSSHPVQLDASALVDYGTNSSTALEGEAKRQTFENLKRKLGAKHVSDD